MEEQGKFSDAGWPINKPHSILVQAACSTSKWLVLVTTDRGTGMEITAD